MPNRIIRSDTNPRNAYAAARDDRHAPRHDALIDSHNVRFAGRYIVQMAVLFMALVLFSIIITAILAAWQDAIPTILPAGSDRMR